MIDTQTSILVTTSVMDPRAVDIARDFLQGYRGDYFFFQYSQYNGLVSNEYILITGTDFEIDEETGYIVTGDNFTVFDITEAITPHTSIESDSITGQIIGIENGVAIQEFNGSVQRTVTSTESKWITQVYTVDHSISFDVSASSSGGQMLTYSSFGQNPRLIGGGQGYAFYISLLLSIGFVCGVFNRLFVKVSHC